MHNLPRCHFSARHQKVAAAVRAEHGIASRKLKAILLTGKLLNAQQLSTQNRAKKRLLVFADDRCRRYYQKHCLVMCPSQLCETTWISHSDIFFLGPQKRLPGHIWMFTCNAFMLTISAKIMKLLRLPRLAPLTSNAFVPFWSCVRVYLSRFLPHSAQLFYLEVRSTNLIPLCSVKSSICVPNSTANPLHRRNAASASASRSISDISTLEAY